MIEAKPESESASALAPFRHGIFRAVWSASLVSNFGGLIQGVGAAWMMTTIATSPYQVALVQASTTLPIMLFRACRRRHRRQLRSPQGDAGCPDLHAGRLGAPDAVHLV
jgi:hypothetical protein